MVLARFSFLAIVTETLAGFRKTMVGCCVTNYVSGLGSFWMSKFMIFYSHRHFSFANFGLEVSFLGISCFFALFIFLLNTLSFVALPIFLKVFFAALLTLTLISHRAVGSYTKFRDRLDLFAFRALFGYDAFSHIRSFQRLWSEPFVGYSPARGLFYFIRNI